MGDRRSPVPGLNAGNADIAGNAGNGICLPRPLARLLSRRKPDKGPVVAFQSAPGVSACRPEGPWEQSPGFSLGTHVFRARRSEGSQEKDRFGAMVAMTILVSGPAESIAPTVLQTSRLNNQQPRLKPGHPAKAWAMFP
jgi:hypothetical protein